MAKVWEMGKKERKEKKKHETVYTGLMKRENHLTDTSEEWQFVGLHSWCWIHQGSNQNVHHISAQLHSGEFEVLLHVLEVACQIKSQQISCMKIKDKYKRCMHTHNYDERKRVHTKAYRVKRNRELLHIWMLISSDTYYLFVRWTFDQSRVAPFLLN